MLAKPGEGAVSSDLTWTVPKRWTVAANPSTFRIATYKVPHAPKDADDAEVSVSQAGGSLNDNIERWEKQFEGAPKAKRSEKTVAGLKITIVDIRGTYLGGMGGAPKKEGMVMLAAIIPTETPHFFKLTGTEATVKAAEPDFNELVASMKKR
jgi:hypothetical protein